MVRLCVRRFAGIPTYPTDEEVLSLITDYQNDFGAAMPFEDARRLLVLYDEICELFERHLPEEDRGELLLD